MEKISIKRNFFFNLFNQLTSVMLPLIVTPYISRIFAADGIGINSYTTANVTYFMLFCMLGISGYGQRTIAICRDNKRETSKVFFELQFIHLITFIITSVLYFCMIFNATKYKVYYIAQYTMLISSFFDINWFYQAYEKFEIITIRNLVIRIITLVLIFTLIHEKTDLALYIFLNGILIVGSNLSLWVGIKNYLEFIPLNQLNFKRHIKDILIFFLPTIAASIYSILDKSVINWVTHDDAQNGYYEQAYKITQVCNVLVQTLATVSAPRMSHVFSNGSMHEFKNRLNTALQYMLMLSMPVAFGVSGIATNFVPVFLGNEFYDVIQILYIFMPMVVILGFSVYLDGMYLVPAGRRLESALAVCAGSAMNLILNFVLVLYFGALGAAIATLMTEVLVSTIMVILSRKIIVWTTVFRAFVKYIICSLLMFIVVHVTGIILGQGILSIIIQIFIGIVTYLLLLIILQDKLLVSYLLNLKNNIRRH